MDGRKRYNQLPRRREIVACKTSGPLPLVFNRFHSVPHIFELNHENTSNRNVLNL